MHRSSNLSIKIVHFTSALLCSGITIFTSSGLPALSKTPQEVAEIAKRINVLVEGATEGSGVLVNKSENTYTVLTAWHVIKGNRLGEEILIRTPDGNSHRTSITNASRVGNIDLATITFTSRNIYSIVSMGDTGQIRQGAPIYVAGYPLSTTAVPVRIMRFLPGQVIAYSSSPLPDGYQILYTNATLPGMSGGSVLSAAGSLLGIHGRGETDSQATQQAGVFVKTGTNLAIPVNLYKPMSTSVKDASTTSVQKAMTKETRFEEYLMAAANTSSLLFREYMTRDDPTTDDLRARRVVSLTTKALEIKESAKAYELRGAVLRQIPGYRLGFPARGSYEYTSSEIERQRRNAIEDFNAAIRLEPNNGRLYIQRGGAFSIFHFISNNVEKARADYRKAIALMPRNLDGYRGLADSYKTDPDKKKVIDMVLQRFPNETEAHVMHGNYLYQRSTKGNPSLIRDNIFLATAAYKQALRLDPKNWSAYRGLADISSDIGFGSSMYKEFYMNNAGFCSHKREDCLKYRIQHELSLKGVGTPTLTIQMANKAISLAPDTSRPMAQLYSMRTTAKSRLGDIVGACRDWRTVLRYDVTQGDLSRYC